MQLIEVAGGTTGYIYTWPLTDAVCNLKPMPNPDDNPMFDEFWVKSKDSRAPSRPKILWEWLAQLCGGMHHLQAMKLTESKYKDMLKYATAFDSVHCGRHST